jgi:hypothetical protein
VEALKREAKIVGKLREVQATHMGWWGDEGEEPTMIDLGKGWEATVVLIWTNIAPQDLPAVIQCPPAQYRRINSV